VADTTNINLDQPAGLGKSYLLSSYFVALFLATTSPALQLATVLANVFTVLAFMAA
jgi:hypothetical protein